MKGRLKPGYYTAAEILEFFPQLKANLTWGAKELAVLHRCNLVVGYYDKHRKIALYTKESVRDLIRHANHVLESQKVNIQTINH